MKIIHTSARFSVLVVGLMLGFAGPVAVFAASPAAINLGAAGNYAILAKTGISTTGATAVVGDLGISPAASTYITGFALTLPSASAYSTSALVTGKVYAPGYADPTTSNLTTAVLDMQNAYTDAMGRAAGVTELGAGNIGGLTLTSGVYKWGTGVLVPTNVTLSGSANDVWIFQIAQNLNLSSGVQIVLSGGAQASNVFWAVAGQTTLGTTAVMNGTVLDQTAIVLNTGAVLNGRALAQSAVTLDASTVTLSSASAVPAVPATPATPAVPTVTPPVSATPATPAVSSSGGSSVSSQSGVAPVSEEAKARMQVQIAELSVTLEALRAQRTMPAASAFGQQVRSIATDFKVGSRGANVSVLQRFLMEQGKGSAARALATHGSTTYFGPLTRAALAEFQASVGISPALGNFGPITRAYVSTHF